MTTTETHEAAPSQHWTSIEERRRQLREWDRGIDTPQEFHILGAGVAGLAAALEILRLEKPGRRPHSVTIYEADPERIGGRIHTQRLGRKPVGPDTRPYFERGAMRIPTSHDYTWTFAREVGLERRRFLNDDRTHDFLGRRYRPTDLRKMAREAYGLHLQEGEGPGTIYAAKVLEPERQALDRQYGSRKVWAERLIDGDISGPGLQRIDELSLAQALKERLTDREERFVSDLLFAGLLDRSFLMFVRSSLTNYGDLYELCQTQGDSVVGGMDLLVRGIAEEVQKKAPGSIRLGRVATRISTNPSGDWAVTFEGGETLRREGRRNRHLLCTFPFSIFQHGDVQLVGFEGSVLGAIHGLPYAHATKIALHLKERFWEPDIKGGRSLTDRPSTSSYYPNDHSPVESIASNLATEVHAPYDLYSQPPSTLGDSEAQTLSQSAKRPGPWLMLSSYTFGERAREMGRQKPESTLRDLQRVFPEVDFGRLYVEEGSETWYWNEKPLARGPFALPTPLAIGRHYRRARTPHRGVFFAGDHISPEPGWIQGSIFSSLYALNDLLREARSDENTSSRPTTEGIS